MLKRTVLTCRGQIRDEKDARIGINRSKEPTGY